MTVPITAPAVVEARTRVAAEPSVDAIVDTLRAIVVAGVATGLVVGGVGSRVFMLVLRLTSPDAVRGVESDDGFEIGRVTLGGSYNLLLLGAAFGVIGAAAYRAVAPWLIGPRWFRRFTTAAASGVVVGAMLLHSDGIDFTVLKPTWLAMGLFVLLPAWFGLAIAVVYDAVARPGSWTTGGRRRWLVPVLLVAPFPLALVPLIVIAPLVLVLALFGSLDFVVRMRRTRTYGLVVRGAWLTIAVIGLVALLDDIRAITAAA